MQQQKYKTGLIIGRFQPFHNGHAYLFEKALELCSEIIIGVGSSNMKNKDNPFSYEERVLMLQEFIKKNNLEERVILIFPSPDMESDDEWLEDVLAKAPEFNIVIGNNDWVNGIFEKAGYKVLLVPEYKRFLYEGTKIRELMREKKDWTDRVPAYMVPLIPHSSVTS